MEFNEFLEEFKKEYGYKRLRPTFISLLKYMFDAFKNNDEKRIKYMEEIVLRNKVI